MYFNGTNSEMTSSAYLTRTDHSDVFFASLHEHLSRGEPSASLAFLLLVLGAVYVMPPRNTNLLVLSAVYVMPLRNTNIGSVRLYTRDLVPSLCVGARCSLCHAPERCQPSTVFRISVRWAWQSRSVRVEGGN